MNNKALIIIVIIVVIIGIFAVLSMQNPNTIAPANMTPDSSAPTVDVSNIPLDTNTHTTATITYNDAGFSPSSVNLKVGDSVTFVNSSSEKMWVASDPHPTHINLPGFDEKAFANPGESWTYTFNALGSHGFHNHANQAMKGTIVIQ